MFSLAKNTLALDLDNCFLELPTLSAHNSKVPVHILLEESLRVARLELDVGSQMCSCVQESHQNKAVVGPDEDLMWTLSAASLSLRQLLAKWRELRHEPAKYAQVSPSLLAMVQVSQVLLSAMCLQVVCLPWCKCLDGLCLPRVCLSPLQRDHHSYSMHCLIHRSRPSPPMFSLTRSMRPSRRYRRRCANV